MGTVVVFFPACLVFRAWRGYFFLRRAVRDSRFLKRCQSQRNGGIVQMWRWTMTELLQRAC